MIHSLTSYLIGNLKEINPWARIRRHQAIVLFEKRRTLSPSDLSLSSYHATAYKFVVLPLFENLSALETVYKKVRERSNSLIAIVRIKRR